MLTSTPSTANGDDQSVKTECGIFAVISARKNFDVVPSVIKGLKELQHRGQESCGISFVSENDGIQTQKDFGFVTEVFPDKTEDNLFPFSTNFSQNFNVTAPSNIRDPSRNSLTRESNICDLSQNSLKQAAINDNDTISTATNACIGHVRYSTSGSSKVWNEIQPISNFSLAIAHNGNIPKLPSPFTHDTTFLFHKLMNSSNILNSLIELVDKVSGAYCLCVLHVENENKISLYIVRDRFGIRPLCVCWDKTHDTLYVSSESCAFENKQLQVIDVGCGDIWKISIENCGKPTARLACQQYHHPKPSYNLCLFEAFYFLRPDSIVDGMNVSKFRTECGEKLAQREFIKFDPLDTVVVGAPFTGILSGKGYANYLNLPYAQLLVKHLKKRTFILPEEREKSCDTIYELKEELIANKIVVLVDDSVVRGNTLKSLAQKFYNAGAIGFHVRVASPQIKSQCEFGIDIPTKQELISHQMKGDIEKIRVELKLDSIIYLDIKDMAQLLASNGIGNFCSGCFTGKYPNGLQQTDLDW